MDPRASAIEGWRTEEEGGLHLMGQFEDTALQGRSVLEKERSGGLGPDD